jgi:hypothetical protein
MNLVDSYNFYNFCNFLGEIFMGIAHRALSLEARTPARSPIQSHSVARITNKQNKFKCEY